MTDKFQSMLQMFLESQKTNQSVAIKQEKTSTDDTVEKVPEEKKYNYCCVIFLPIFMTLLELLLYCYKSITF